MKSVDGRLKLLMVPLAILLPALVIVLLFAKPAAPKEVELFAGQKGSAYYSYAQKYAEFFRERGVTVNIVETAGSIENLRSLAGEERPAAAFALSGVDAKVRNIAGFHELQSLGSLSFQPLWLFVRSVLDLTKLSDLSGLRVALGPAESDARAIAKAVLTDNQVEDGIVEPSLSEQSPDAMAGALIQGDLDAAFFIGQPRSPIVSRLLDSGAARPVAIQRIAAYTRLHPELAEIVLPEGLFDMARNTPEADLHLLSPADNLVVRSDLNPAVVDLLLDAARSIHREPTLFAPRGTFPNMNHVSLPLSEATIHFYEDGPPPWRRYLPPWLATLISRFALIVAQVGAVVWILLKSVPAFIRLRFSMKTLGIYQRMEKLEKELMAGGDWEPSVARLTEIDRETADFKVPRGRLSEYMELRQNVHDLRERMHSWHEESAESV